MEDGGSGLVTPGNVGHLKDLGILVTTLLKKISPSPSALLCPVWRFIWDYKVARAPKAGDTCSRSHRRPRVLGLSNEGGSLRTITHLVQQPLDASVPDWL